MKRVLIGHRGVGKTSLLQRHQQYFPRIKHFDLDLEIAKKNQDTFTHFSEDIFRKNELETYRQIVTQNENYVIALGAGFLVSEISKDDEVIFVSRNTDFEGRIFLNRPRLDPMLTALAESQLRYSQRDKLYRGRANFIYHMPEGIDSINTVEEKILTFNFQVNDAYYTLNPNEFARIKNFSKIELRTDLFSQEAILDLLNKYSNHDWLVSFRNSEDFNVPAFVKIDRDIRFFKKTTHIVSTHTDNIDQAIQEVKAYAQFQIKLCPLVKNFAELKTGHDWQQENPKQRSFVPRSNDGIWNWYRLVSRYNQEIHFIRNFNEQIDQASLYQWLSLPAKKPETWAGVLGQPIHFSRSPLQHETYFKNKNSFMCAVDLETESFQNNFEWLTSLGLGFAAVTSPLKEKAFQASIQLSSEANELNSVNTLFIQKMKGHNTDLAGFNLLVSGVDQDHTAVWGGGGTLQMMKKVLPKATYFSSQTGQTRDNEISNEKKFKTLIWAAPRHQNTLFPPLDWTVDQIIDLNYVENSMGLEYAQKLILNGHQVNYISGLEMFREQARKQQEFWSAQ